MSAAVVAHSLVDDLHALTVQMYRSLVMWHRVSADIRPTGE